MADSKKDAGGEGWIAPGVVGAVTLIGGLAIAGAALAVMNSNVILAYAVATVGLVLLSGTVTATVVALTQGLWSGVKATLVAPILGVLLQPLFAAYSVPAGFAVGFVVGLALAFTPVGNVPFAAYALPILSGFLGAFVAAFVVTPAVAHSAAAVGVTWFFTNAAPSEGE